MPKPLEHWSQDKQDRMREMQVAVVKALTPFRGRTEPELITLACITPAYSLLRAMPEPFRTQLVDVICAFLKGKTPPAGVDLWLPPDMLQ